MRHTNYNIFVCHDSHPLAGYHDEGRAVPYSCEERVRNIQITFKKLAGNLWFQTNFIPLPTGSNI